MLISKNEEHVLAGFEQLGTVADLERTSFGLCRYTLVDHLTVLGISISQDRGMNSRHSHSMQHIYNLNYVRLQSALTKTLEAKD